MVLLQVFFCLSQGKRVELKLRVFSSFAQEMSVDSVTTVPPDPRFSFRADKKKRRILPDQKSLIGKVVFDPGAECEEDESCYVGFDTNSKRTCRKCRAPAIFILIVHTGFRLPCVSKSSKYVFFWS